MNPVRAALRYPQVTLFLSAVVFLLGVYSMVRMPRREDPKITIRTGIVAAMYPGATSQEVEDQVTRKIEEHLFHFEEVRREKTYSTTRNGMVVINVELNKSVTNADQFWSKLRLDLALLKAQELPAGVQGPMVDSDFGDTVAVLIAVHGGSYGYRELKDYARTVEDGVRTLPMVSKIHRIGDQPEAIEVDSSNAQLSQYGVTPLQVMQALQGRNTVEYAGRVSDGSNKVPIQSGDRLHSEDDIRQMMVDVSRTTGQPVYIRDLANVHRTYKDPDNYVRMNGEPAILLSVEMHEGNNIDDLGKDLKAKLAKHSGRFSTGRQARSGGQPAQDGARARPGLHEGVRHRDHCRHPGDDHFAASPGGAGGCDCHSNLHRHDLQHTPVCHVEIQQVSIAALIIVLGMVVDNAIVIVDNYIELLDHGVPIDEAAERSASEMAVPVLAATLAIIAAFAPMLYLSGATGEFIRALPRHRGAVAVHLLPGGDVPDSDDVEVVHPDRTADGEPREVRTSLRSCPSSITCKRAITCSSAGRCSTRSALSPAPCSPFWPDLVSCPSCRNTCFRWLSESSSSSTFGCPRGPGIETTDATTRRIESVLAHESLVKEYASYLGSSFPRFYYNVNPQIPACELRSDPGEHEQREEDAGTWSNNCGTVSGKLLRKQR